MQSIEAKTDATTLEQGALGALGVDRCEYSNRICQMKVLFSSLNNNKQFHGTNATAIHKSTFYVKLIDWL